MSKKSISMKRVYDIFAEETRKQARLYGLDLQRKTQPKGEKKRDMTDAHRKAARLIETA